MILTNGVHESQEEHVGVAEESVSNFNIWNPYLIKQ
jgi:hypothetical protein